jgi:hypothetical protein
MNLLSDEVSVLKIEKKVPSDFGDLVESKDNGSASECENESHMSNPALVDLFNAHNSESPSGLRP